MDKYHRLLNNGFLLLLGNFGSKIVSFLMVRYYTGVFSQSQYGIIDLIVTTAGFVVPIITLGINEAVFRFSISDVENRPKIYGSSLLIAFIGNLLLMIGCLAIKLDTGVFAYKYLLLAFCVTDSFFILTANFCRGVERTALYAWTGIFHSVVQILVAILSISVFKLGITGYIVAFVVSNVLSCLLIWLRIGFFKSIKAAFSLDKNLIIKMLVYSIPLIANTCCWWIMASLDKYVIAIQLGSDSNGLYAAASKIPAVITTIGTILFQAWQISAVAEMNSEEKEKFFSEIHDSFYITIAVLSSLVVAFLRPIYHILVGEDFFEAWVYTPFLIIAMNFSCLASFYGSNYVAMKKTKGALWTSAVAAIINSGLNILLTIKFGMYGTAFATMFSYFVLWIIRIFNTRSFVRIKTNFLKMFITFCILLIQAILICLNLYDIRIELLFCFLLILLHIKTIVRIMCKVKNMFGSQLKNKNL